MDNTDYREGGCCHSSWFWKINVTTLNLKWVKIADSLNLLLKRWEEQWKQKLIQAPFLFKEETVGQ